MDREMIFVLIVMVSVSVCEQTVSNMICRQVMIET